MSRNIYESTDGTSFTLLTADEFDAPVLQMTFTTDYSGQFLGFLSNNKIVLADGLLSSWTQYTPSIVGLVEIKCIR
jgi:hypothetical protein